MQNVKQGPSLQIDLFSNLPVMDSWWKKLSMTSRLSFMIAITWLPLLIFSFIEGSIYNLNPKQTFFSDYAIHLRFLIAMPLLLLSCLKSGVKIRQVLNHFFAAEIISEEDKDKFQDEVNYSMKLRDSKIAKTILLIVIYAFTIYFIRAFASVNVESWRTMQVEGGTELTRAGWWFVLISQPLYFYTLFYFLYRAVLWGRLLFKISRMHLHLSPSHGDGVGGLGFLERSIATFILPVLAISVSLAGGMINLVLFENFQIGQLKLILVFLVTVYFLIFIFPLFFFSVPLKRAKQAAVLHYGVMAGKMIHEFEGASLFLRPRYGEEGYESMESTLSLVERVHNMRIYPIQISNLIPIILAMLLPFLPVFALEVPWNMILERLVKLVL